MSTLLLKLAAPLQAWGINSKFEVRRTGREPSKSGVVGLLAAALGRRRDAPVHDLAALRFGVRVDQEGQVIRDFHMVHKDEKSSYVTTRDYLSDAVFLVGLESADEAFLQMLDNALRAPAFALFLGRRSCPPTLPLTLGVQPQPLLEALAQAPWQACEAAQARLCKKQGQENAVLSLRLIADDACTANGTAFQKDVPLSFDPSLRQYGYRAIKNYAPAVVCVQGQTAGHNATAHDPMQELR